MEHHRGLEPQITHGHLPQTIGVLQSFSLPSLHRTTTEALHHKQGIGRIGAQHTPYKQHLEVGLDSTTMLLVDGQPEAKSLAD